MDEYKTDTIEDAITSYFQHLSIVIEEESTISISFGAQTKNFHSEEDEIFVRNQVKEICDYIINSLDETYTTLDTQKARFERETIEKRYFQNIEDLNKAELELKTFSEKYGVIALPEQLEASIKTAADIESKIIMSQVELDILQRIYSKSSIEVTSKEIYINELVNTLRSYKNIGSLKDSLSVLPSFKSAPELLTQQYEQIRIQETKQTPSLQFIDMPRIPTKRTKPNRGLIVISMVFAGMSLALFYVYLFEKFLVFKVNPKEYSENY